MSRRFIVAVLLFALVAVALVAQPNVASRVLDRVFSDMEIDALVNDAVNELSDAEALLSSGAQLASTTSLNVRYGESFSLLFDDTSIAIWFKNDS